MNPKQTGRVPPNSVEAEMSVLGSMLLNNTDAVSKAVEFLSRDDFFREANGEIFDAMAKLRRSGSPVDVVTLKDELTRRGELDKVGGYYYLLQLADYTPTPTNLLHYAQIIKDKKTLRDSISICNEVLTLAYGEVDSASSVVALGSDAFSKLIGTTLVEKSQMSENVVMDYLAIMEARHEDSGRPKGVVFSLSCLRHIVRSVKPGHLAIVAARPSMGKSALVMQEAYETSKRDHVLCVSLEMPKEDVLDRLAASLSGVDPEDIATGRVVDDEKKMKRFTSAVKRLYDAKLHWMDDPSSTVKEISAEAHRIKRKYGSIGGVFVDYLQYIEKDPSMGRADQREIVAYNSKALKMLARQLEVPVIVASQLSRKVEEREDKMPELSDLAESGGIERDADLVLFIMRPDYYKKDNKTVDYMKPEPALLIAAKQRNGRTGMVKAMYIPALTRFQDDTSHLTGMGE